MMQNEAMLQESVLIIGIGNPLRGDDRAGWVLAEALAGAWAAAGRAVTLRLVQQVGPELAEELAELRPGAVLFADAAAGQAEPRLVSLPAGGPVETGGAAGTGGPVGSTHHLDPAWVLAIAQRLYAFACPAWLVTAPAVAFPHGDELSDVAVAGVAAAVALVEGVWGEGTE